MESNLPLAILSIVTNSECPKSIQEIQQQYSQLYKAGVTEEQISRALETLVHGSLLAKYPKITENDEDWEQTDKFVHSVKFELSLKVGDFLNIFKEEEEKIVQEKVKQKKVELVSQLSHLHNEANKLKSSFSQSQNYISNLHNYNELKEICFNLAELISKKRNTPLKELLEEFDIKNWENSKDILS